MNKRTIGFLGSNKRKPISLSRGLLTLSDIFIYWGKGRKRVFDSKLEKRTIFPCDENEQQESGSRYEIKQELKGNVLRLEVNQPAYKPLTIIVDNIPS